MRAQELGYGGSIENNWNFNTKPERETIGKRLQTWENVSTSKKQKTKKESRLLVSSEGIARHPATGANEAL